MHIILKSYLIPLRRLACVLILLFTQAARGWSLFERYQPQVLVSDPYIELRTGPGRGYPIFYVAGQGDAITILKRKTDWFKVRTPREKEGWVHMSEMQHTLDLDGQNINFSALGIDDFSKRDVRERLVHCGAGQTIADAVHHL